MHSWIFWIFGYPLFPWDLPNIWYGPGQACTVCLLWGLVLVRAALCGSVVGLLLTYGDLLCTVWADLLLIVWFLVLSCLFCFWYSFDATLGPCLDLLPLWIWLCWFYPFPPVLLRVAVTLIVWLPAGFECHYYARHYCWLWHIFAPLWIFYGMSVVLVYFSLVVRCLLVLVPHMAPVALAWHLIWFSTFANRPFWEYFIYPCT
jgi:hypothetical protein